MGGIGKVDESTWFFRWIVRNRVTWGYVCAGVFLVFASPSQGTVFFGFWPALLGATVRTWASGTISKNRELATEGPYRLTRNPLYFGSFFIGLGIAVMGGRLWFPLLFAAFFLPVYGVLIRHEEKKLLGLYGDTFREYCHRVPRFWPRMNEWPPPEAPFDARRMWQKHKEWQAWLGLYAVTLYLLLRAV